jgi:MGT family glycosyltransferase
LPTAARGPARLQIAAARLLFRLGTRSFRRAANRLRREHGLAPIGVSATEFALRMPLYLIAGTRELDFDRRDLPPSVHYVGPCTWERPRTGSPPAWLQTRRRDQPWIYVSEGTIHTQEPVVSRAAVQGLADLPMQVIVSTGSSGDASSQGLGPIAPNVQLEHWVNLHYSDLLPLASVVVTTGGAGTVLASLQSGVPLVIVPTEWDKPDVAQRVVAAGAALRLSLSACTPERLRLAVNEVLGTPAFRQNAQRIAASLAACDGPAEAARLLEELSLRNRSPVPAQ